ncbi:hypothetical protein SPBR_03564 [Sporothrix brasiliensis 5110]|uniref:polynucleotide adenylyltransferase n=1 Tax=Sporothrix brasiliensis 5110 TaxID=1398154 RepID=A0A0C2FUU1_9PEZI|nr:uncharacterized protein SPBR_03564 [Sporothrix brasiliensis 5110]KIH94778.1 hypothetical protein SPBR_03564 [Sporothrix brasiliensis 5110]
MANLESDSQGMSFTLNSHATALCFIPPESEWPPVDRLRTLYDKAARKWPPHVNLVYPFVQPESLDAASQRIQSFLKDEPEDPIHFRLNTAGVFAQRYEKTLHLKDGDEGSCIETLRHLRFRIVKALAGGDAAKEDYDSNSYRMHMTVAQSNNSASANYTAAAETDVAAGAAATPDDTHGHAHRFLLHKVERVPPVTWTADRLHIVLRERLTKTRGNRRDAEVVATSSRMRLWGVIYLDDGRIEKLSPTQTFYDELPFDADRTSGDVETDETGNVYADQERDSELPAFQCVTFAPEDNEWIRCSDEHDLYTSLASVSPTPGALSVATYNVLGEFEWPPVEDRFPLLIKNLLATNATADMLVLQEVTDHFLTALLGDDGIRSAYPFASHGPPDQEDMEPLPSLLNMVVLSRRPFAWSWLGLHRAHKGALIARFDREDGDVEDDNDDEDRDEDGKKYGLVLATVHLTHGLTNGSVASKRAELQRLFGHLERYYPSHRADAVVVAGDLNIHSSSFAIEAAIRRKGISAQTARYVETGFDELFAQYGFTDTYCATQTLSNIHGQDDERPASDEAKHDLRHDNGDILLYDGEEGATYNPFTNALAARIVGSGLNTRPERFDRILVRGGAKDYMNEHDGDGQEDEYGRSQYRIAGYNSFGFPSASMDHSSASDYASDHWGIRCSFEPAGDEDEEGDDDTAATTLAIAKEAVEAEAERPDISADIEKLIVPVLPLRTPAGPLVDGGTAAVTSALTKLDVIPSDDEISRRKAAFDRLKAIILDEEAGIEPAKANARSRQLVVVAVGSYGLGVWTPSSDMDCLCIGPFGSQTFFALATQRLRAAGIASAGAGGDAADAVKIIRRVRAHTGTMLELEINGIRMDLQYCGAAVIAETWPAVLVLPQTHPVFALSPQTLSKLKAARDLYYFRKSFPDMAADTAKICSASNFRTAHRAIKTWARARGLYAARFGYLGGIQIALLLARVMKLMQRAVDKATEDVGDAASDNAEEYTVADILVTFFQHYADFDWTTKMAFDPFFHNQKAPYAPSSREPLAILGYHRPQLNTSMAASVPSVRVLSDEFKRAASLLREGKDGLTWSAFFDGGRSTIPPALLAGPAEFVRAYRSYIKLDLQYWGLSLARGSSFVGWLESRCVLLLVDLARRLPTLNARIWPGRFVQAEEESEAKAKNTDDADETRQYQGCYLVGLDLPATMTRDERRIALGTLQTILAHFEKQIRRGGDGHTNAGHFDPQWQWIDVSVANRADLGNVDRLRLDDRAWGQYTPGDEESDDDDDEEETEEGAVESEESGGKDDGEVTHNEDGEKVESGEEGKTKKGKGGKKNAKKLPLAVAHRPGGGKFRTAQDVIKRLRWDPHLDRSDFIVGYEDRFLGARERPLESWKSEQTHEEFIPQHRILYFKRRSDGVVVWDRRTRKDDVFGSGVSGAI